MLSGYTLFSPQQHTLVAIAQSKPQRLNPCSVAVGCYVVSNTHSSDSNALSKLHSRVPKQERLSRGSQGDEHHVAVSICAQVANT